MESWAGYCISQRHTVVKYVDDYLQCCGDNSAAAGRAGNQDRLIVFQYDGRTHGAEHALPGLNTVRLAANQAVVVGHIFFQHKIIHFIVEQEPCAGHYDFVAIGQV